MLSFSMIKAGFVVQLVSSSLVLDLRGDGSSSACPVNIKSFSSKSLTLDMNEAFNSPNDVSNLLMLVICLK